MRWPCRSSSISFTTTSASTAISATDLIFTSLPFTLDADKCGKLVDDHHATTSKSIMDIEKHRQTAMPCFEHIAIIVE